jgi:hypothetical protein
LHHNSLGQATFTLPQPQMRHLLLLLVSWVQVLRQSLQLWIPHWRLKQVLRQMVRSKSS